MTTRPEAAKGKFSKQRWATLSEQQQAVIKFVLDEHGHLELMARAGCGKTFTLMQVVDAIVEFGLGDVALMAFNKSIADDQDPPRSCEVRLADGASRNLPLVRFWRLAESSSRSEARGRQGHQDHPQFR